MEKAFVAQRVAKKLFVTEAAVDGALAEASELMSEMLKARKDVNASLVFADDAAVKMVEAIRALSEARTAMVAVHGELNEAKLRLGIRTKMGLENKHFLTADVAETSRSDVSATSAVRKCLFSRPIFVRMPRRSFASFSSPWTATMAVRASLSARIASTIFTAASSANTSEAFTSLRALSISLISSEASASAPSTAASVTNSFLATRCA